MMNNIFKTISCLFMLSLSINFIIAQNTDCLYNKLLDSTLMASGKISLRLKGDFKLTRQQNSEGICKLEFRDSSDVLFAKTWYNISDSMAAKMIDDKKFLIENLFKTQPSPYPDVVSNQVKCPDHLLPTSFDTLYSNLKLFAFRLFANERFIYGECTDDIIIYISAFIVVYNIKEKTLSEIKYFTPRSNPVNIPEVVMRSLTSVD